jgi:hypothetical protein
MVEIPTPKAYIFMIGVTRQNKCLIAQAPGDHTPPLPEVNFIMVKIPTLKPYIFMIGVTRQIKCIIAQGPSLVSIGLALSEERIFEKVYDVRRTTTTDAK